MPIMPCVHMYQKAITSIVKAENFNRPCGERKMEAIASVALRGATLATEEGNLQLDWLMGIGSFFAVNYEREPCPDDPVTAVDWAVNVEVRLCNVATNFVVDGCPSFTPAGGMGF